MRELLYDGKILRLERLDGKWEVVRHQGSVAVLVMKGSDVLGVRQQRPATGHSTWEVPAGLIDPGETPMQAAQRELAEEVQLKGNLTLIARFFTSPGFSDELTSLYLLEDPQVAYGKPDAGEQLTPTWLNAHEAWEATLTGELATSSVTAVALQFALAQLGDDREG